MKRIIVYGYGKAYHKLKEKLNGCEVLAFADQKAEEIIRAGKGSDENAPFVCPKDISSFEYDYVAISTGRKNNIPANVCKRKRE